MMKYEYDIYGKTTNCDNSPLSRNENVCESSF